MSLSFRYLENSCVDLRTDSHRQHHRHHTVIITESTSDEGVSPGKHCVRCFSYIQILTASLLGRG